MVLVWVTLISSALVLVIVGPAGFVRNWPIAVTIALTTATLCYWLVHLVTFVEQRIRRQLGAQPAQHQRPYYFFLSALFMPAGIFLGFAAARTAAKLLELPFEQPAWAEYRQGLLFGLPICAVMFLIEMQRDARAARLAAEVRLQAAENERLKAQLAALTAQINPHMLFNALNTVASLIPSDAAAAEQTVIDLSQLLRCQLHADRQRVHALSDELALCQRYLALEERRFADRLRVELDVPPQAGRDVACPLLCLQPLLENAIKYAVAPRAGGGSVKISVREQQDHVIVSVCDDGPGPGKSSVPPGTNTAIANIRRRLELNYGARASLTLREQARGGTVAELIIPRAAK